MSRFNVRPHPCEGLSRDYVVFEKDDRLGPQMSFNKEDLPALRDAIDAYLRPDYTMTPTPDDAERIVAKLLRAAPGKAYVSPPGAKLGASSTGDKDPLPVPSLRDEIANLHRRLTHLEELIAIV